MQFGNLFRSSRRNRRAVMAIALVFLMCAGVWAATYGSLAESVTSGHALAVSAEWIKSGLFALIVLAAAGIACRCQLASIRPETESEAASDGIPGSSPQTRFSVLLLISVAVVIASGSFVIFDRLKQNETQKIEQNLAAIAQLKSHQIVDWLEQHKKNATVFTKYSAFAERAHRWLSRNGAHDADAGWIKARLDYFTREYAYGEITLIDMAGRPRLSTDDSLPDASEEQSLIRQVMAQKKTMAGKMRLNVFPDGSEYVSLPIAAPLVLSGKDEPVVGVLLVDLNVSQFLFPLIQSWTTPSQSAETLLITVEGDELLVLNSLRFRQDSALKMRIPLRDSNLLIAQATNGATGLVEGIDYRGVPSVGYSSRVPGTDWILLSKMEASEVYYPIWRLACSIVVIALLTMSVVRLFHYFWRRQRMAELEKRNAQFRAAQLELKLQEQLLSKQFDYLTKYANDIILLLNEAGAVVEANERAETAYGYARQELLGMNIRNLRAPSDANPLEDQFETVKRSEKLFFESVHVRKDGREFPVEVNSRAIRTDSGLFVQSIIRDIVERKRAEEALRESENRYRALFEKMDESLVVVEMMFDEHGRPADWRYIDSNPQAERYMGMTRDQLLGRTYREVVPDPDEDWIAFLGAVALGGGAATQERFAPTRGRWLRVHAYSPRHGLAALLFTDITEQRRAEEELKLAAMVFENSSEAIMVVDDRNRIVAVNPALEIITGYGKRNVIGQEPGMLLSDQHDDVFCQLFRDELRSSGAWKGEIWSRTRQGKVIAVQMSINSTFTPDGAVQRRVVVFSDITERKRSEEELKLAAMVYQDSTEAMLVTDENNNIIAVNRAFHAITGFSVSDAIGKNPRIMKSDRHGTNFYGDMWKQITTTGRFKGEVWNRKKNGDYFAAQLTINTIHDGNGKPYRYVGLLSDITEKKMTDDMIWMQANYDNLTGLPNRRLFRDRITHEIRNAKRTQLPVALLFLDLDGFKDINDTLGHDMGDMLLKAAAERLNGCVRESDTVARLGGDEFTVILTELNDPENVDKIARHILQTLSAPFYLDDEVAYVSASIGITLYPQDAEHVEELIKNADQAMYAAKMEGKNRYYYFTPSMQEAAVTRIRLVNDLRSALNGNQFEIVYQPIVDLTSCCIKKAEALIRWQHPKRGLINPIEFISAAEDTGMIASFGNWMFLEAAEQAAIWRRRYRQDFQISVNLSPVQFKNEGIDSLAWLERLRMLNLPGQGVVVEITEGLLLDASAKVKQQLLVLRDAGIEVSLDDFGTGYSSLSYLNKFDIDYLKIDQSFVRNLTPVSDDMALCEAIIAMAHRLGIKVIAEGVETRVQQELLADIGCDFAQGYLFSKPLPARQFEQLLQTNPFALQELLDI